MEKRCSICSETKSIKLFSKAKGGKFGVRGNCKECESLRFRQYRLANKQKLKNNWKKWYETNSECRKTYRKKYYEDNADKLREKTRNIKKKEPHKYAAYNSKRRACKLKATPKWLNKKDLQKMRDIYWLAKDLKAVSGEEYHVDHIIPLKGKNICGLHVPWNLQILPKDLNLKKANAYETTTKD